MAHAQGVDGPLRAGKLGQYVGGVEVRGLVAMEVCRGVVADRQCAQVCIHTHKHKNTQTLSLTHTHARTHMHISITYMCVCVCVCVCFVCVYRGCELSWTRSEEGEKCWKWQQNFSKVNCPRTFTLYCRYILTFQNEKRKWRGCSRM